MNNFKSPFCTLFLPGIRGLKLDLDPEKFENRIRIRIQRNFETPNPDPEKFEIRIRIRTSQKQIRNPEKNDKFHESNYVT